MAPARAQAVAAVAGACAGVLVTLAVMQRRKKACKPKKKKPAKVATLRHIVLVKLKPDTPDEAIEAMLAGLAELPKKIPTILRMEIGRQHAAVDDGRNVTVVADHWMKWAFHFLVDADPQSPSFKLPLRLYGSLGVRQVFHGWSVGDPSVAKPDVWTIPKGCALLARACHEFV